MDILNQLGASNNLDIEIVSNSAISSSPLFSSIESPLPTLSPKQDNKPNRKKNKGMKDSDIEREVILTISDDVERKLYLGWDIGIKNLAFCNIIFLFFNSSLFLFFSLLKSINFLPSLSNFNPIIFFLISPINLFCFVQLV